MISTATVRERPQRIRQWAQKGLPVEAAVLRSGIGSLPGQEAELDRGGAVYQLDLGRKMKRGHHRSELPSNRPARK